MLVPVFLTSSSPVLALMSLRPTTTTALTYSESGAEVQVHHDEAALPRCWTILRGSKLNDHSVEISARHLPLVAWRIRTVRVTERSDVDQSSDPIIEGRHAT